MVPCFSFRSFSPLWRGARTHRGHAQRSNVVEAVCRRGERDVAFPVGRSTSCEGEGAPELAGVHTTVALPPLWSRVDWARGGWGVPPPRRRQRHCCWPGGRHRLDRLPPARLVSAADPAAAAPGSPPHDGADPRRCAPGAALLAGAEGGGVELCRQPPPNADGDGGSDALKRTTARVGSTGNCPAPCAPTLPPHRMGGAGPGHRLSGHPPQRLRALAVLPAPDCAVHADASAVLPASVTRRLRARPPTACAPADCRVPVGVRRVARHLSGVAARPHRRHLRRRPVWKGPAGHRAAPPVLRVLTKWGLEGHDVDGLHLRGCLDTCPRRPGPDSGAAMASRPPCHSNR